MANYTPNLNLKKPERTDFFSVNDFNGNADLIDTAVGDIDTALDSKLNTDFSNISGGTIPISAGGTGATTAAGALTNLGVDTALSNKADKDLSNVTGAIPISNGGTGATTAAGALTSLGIDTALSNKLNTDFSNISGGAIPISAGGTGNTDGYIRAGQKSGTTVGTGATCEGYDTTASGTYSHAEGENTTASGQSSHAEGDTTIANVKGAHAEGQSTTASGLCSHAEGYATAANRNYSHAEGHTTTAYGNYSHTEGYQTTTGESTSSNGLYAHAEGLSTKATGQASHAEGNSTKAIGEASHAEGTSTKASGTYSHAEGESTTASGRCSHAEGYDTKAYAGNSHAEGSQTEAGVSGGGSNGKGAHAEGYQTKAKHDYSHAEGTATTVEGRYSHAEGNGTSVGYNVTGAHTEGYQTKAYADYSHAEGYQTQTGVSGQTYGVGSHAEGYGSQAKGNRSHAEGWSTIANYIQTVVGMFNVEYGGTTSYTADDGFFIVGCGDASNRANCFRATESNTYGLTYNSSGADYAEMFEWVDANIDNEDRSGKFVTLDGDKIKLATDKDDYILGVVSGNPSVVGDAYGDQWSGMFEKDVYGRPIYTEVTIPEEKDKDGNIIIPEHVDSRLKVSSKYDNKKQYIPRNKRSEWSPIGLLGKLVCIDDGTAQINRYVKPNENSIATHSKEKTKYRVMKRIDKTHIQIMIL